MKSPSEFKPFLIAILVLVILVGVLAPGGKSFVALALLPIAFIDRSKAIFALIALFLVRMSNTAITGPDPLLATTAWMTALVASTRLWIEFVLHRRFRMLRQMKALSIFVLVVLVLSAYSMSPIISILKVLSFYYIAGAVIAGITSPAPTKMTGLAWLYAAWTSVVLTSILTLPFPEVGYFRDGQGFQGSLNHPQLFGIFMAPMLAWILANSFRATRLSLRNAAILILIIGMLIITRARTGIVSVILAAVILSLFRTGEIKLLVNWLTRRKAMLALLSIALLMSPVLYTQLRGAIDDYIFKSATSHELGAAFEESRGFIILQAINNIENHPVTGIGFGIANSESHDFNLEIDSVTGLPIGAPTEKANLIIAIIEETGIIGFIAFAAFFLSFLRVIANSGNIALAWTAITSICTNISEMTFFSMGGAGVYTWIICAIAMALAPSQR
jgi:hypothetical protein